jgi:putative oxidoreductase
MTQCKKIVEAIARGIDWLPGLVSRLTIAGVFLQTGWGKLHNLDKVTQFFASLGIPAARFQAPMVACIEFGCGLLILLGLFTRLAAVPLIGTMVVAILTVKMKSVAEYSDFLSLSEYLFIVLLLWLVVKGAGAVSIDYFLRKRRDKTE